MNALFLALLALGHAAATQNKPRIVSAVSAVSPSPSLKPLQLYDSSRYDCPVDCNQSGLGPSGWTVYHDKTRLALCNSTMLLDFALFNPLDDPNTHTTIRACAFGADNDATLHEDITPNATATRIDKRGSSLANQCVSLGEQSQVTKSLQMAFNGSETSASLQDFNAAAYQLFDQLATQEASCEQVISFAYSNTAAIGVYVGSALQSQALATSVLQSFISSINSGGYSESNLVQLCSNQSSKFIMGVVANANADLVAVQEVVATWASGDCVSTYDRTSVLDSISMSIPALSLISGISANNTTFINGTASINGTYQGAAKLRNLAKRGDCTTVKVAAGDTCECATIDARYTRQLTRLFPR
jgi:chitinase